MKPAPEDPSNHSRNQKNSFKNKENSNVDEIDSLSTPSSSPSTPFQKILFNPSILGMLTMVILVGTGEKLAERFLPLYLITLGGGFLSVGFLSGMDNLLSALYSFPGGYLSDKIGYKKALVVFNVMAMIGFLIVILIPTWWAVIIGALFFISWTAISLPAVMSLVSNIVPKTRRTMGVTLHSLTRRIPMAVGPVIGGVIIGYFSQVLGIRISFSIALGLAAVALLLEWFLIKEKPQEKKEPIRIRDSLQHIKPNLRILLISDILVRFAEQIPYAFVVIWVVDMQGLTETQFGVLTSIEMVTAMIIYIPIAYLADRSTKKPFVVITFGFFTIFPLVLIFSKTFLVLAIAFIIRGLKEFGEPTRKALILDLAPEEAKASTFGTYYLIRDVIVSIAAFGGAFLWKLNPIVNLSIASVCGLLGTVVFVIFGKDLRSTKTQKIEEMT